MEPRVIETAREALGDLEEYLSGAAALDPDAPAARPRSSLRSARLTQRERDVLALVADGCTTTEVAEALYVSPHTVRSRIKSSLKKLGAHTRAHAIAIVIREGAVGPS
ncbi:MAG TPA: helix-turn-helix transcriptional regulator [Thermoleophilaceae bacterium]|jgi:DNA-binding CsgD family transcriptional regulator